VTDGRTDASTTAKTLEALLAVAPKIEEIMGDGEKVRTKTKCLKEENRKNE